MVILSEEDKTYIQVSRTVANKLNDLKIVPRESYEDVLRRLLKIEKRTSLNKPKVPKN